MFPMISSNGVFEDPSTFLEEDKFLEDLLVDFPISENINEKSTKNKKRARKISASSEVKENIKNQGSSSDSKKKSAHKFMEKQRRTEMSSLYAQLRSLLPLQYIKGKRAVSDHMSQAVKYIDDMKKNIEQMKIRKSSIVVEAENQINSDMSVEINLFKDGLMEILISSSLTSKKGFPLSMVLKDLSDRRQLNVINCVNTRAKHCYLHKIQIQIDDFTSIDVSELQEGLVKVIKLA